nr:MFS transporter [Streptomyces sp. NBC_01723]
MSWGIVYYAFPVLNPEITAATGRPTGATTAAFSLALVVSALAGIRGGRILDRRGPRAVMTVGSMLGAISLLTVSAATNLAVFTAGRMLAGLAMAAIFYQPAFAAITRWWAPDHVRALTIVTLAGGLASTVFAPLTAALADHLSWRHTYLVLAAILAAVTIPAHALALRAPWPAHRRVGCGRHGPRQSHPGAGHCCHRPLGHYPLRSAVRAARGPGDHRRRPGSLLRSSARRAHGWVQPPLFMLLAVVSMSAAVIAPWTAPTNGDPFGTSLR